jgi:TRAP-type C4-dicarboxylate transport system substrate-binding protein
MKKLLGIVLALALLLSCTAALADPVKLTYAEVNPLDGTIVGEMAKAFKAKAEELSGGEIEIDIQAGGVLGSEDQILDNLLGGGNITDISRISAFALTQYGCSKASLLSIPYTFVNEEHFWKFADSELAQEFLLEPQELGLGLRGLCYGEEGFRHFFFKTEVKTLEDLKGLKIRVSSDPVMTGMVSDLGASATTVAFTELYSALNTGVVDGAEQPTANYRSNAFQEVAPYLLLDGHTLGALQIIITDAAWNKLSEQQQGWIMEASKYASQVCREKVAEIEAQTFELLKQDGATVIEVEDKTPWVEACQETIKKNTEAQADLYQKILDMQ